MNILIIDDERTVLRTVYSQLSEMGLTAKRIDLAESAEEARRLMEQYGYDIFLCDIVMPKEDGISFAKWVLERQPDAKIIFLTAYADIHYMREAISMHSFDYVLQPVEPEDLRNVVERAVAQIKIEQKNRELMNTGAFFQDYEEDILEIGALEYLTGGKDVENTYLRRLVVRHGRSKPGESLYMPVLVQILKSEKKLEEIEKPILRVIYQNILDEVFQSLHVRSIIMLEENRKDFALLLYWNKELSHDRETLVEKLEEFRILAFRVLQTSVAVYCGDFAIPADFASIMSPLLQARDNNVRQESRVFRCWKYMNDAASRSYELQLGTWKKLLDQDYFVNFRESIMTYINGDSHRGNMNASSMMNLHQSVTQIILLYLVDHQISSDRIFDENLNYLTYMNAWQRVDLFENALKHITDRLQEIVGKRNSRDIIQEVIEYIQHHLDRDLAVSEIAEYAGMNSEYLTKLFKKNTGYTLKEYITNEKMESAKMLLATTDLSVTLIAGYVGYGNYSNFTRSFKQLVGCTPAEYRKKS